MLSSSHQRRLLAFLERPRVHREITLLALLLLAPVLGTRLLMDDFVLAVKAAPGTVMSELPAQPLGLFTFTTGDAARNGALMDEGALLPWWTAPNHLNAFFRPLSAATHVLDFRLWPQAAWLMHAHSLVWYGVLLLVLARVYRTLEPHAPLLAAFALLLYAVDDAHGATVGWVSNRNALIATALALPALSAHHRAASQQWRAGSWLAALWFMLGLCAGEAAIGIFGYLLAYAVCLDTRALRARLLSLTPYFALLGAHRVLYRVFGLGSFGSSGYHDPLREPVAFAGMLGYNLPLLLSSELFVPVSDIAFWGDVRGRAVLWVWSVVTLLIIAIGSLAILRRDAHARFWSLGMVLSAVPVSASLPGERLLLALGFGAAPLLARLLHQYSALATVPMRGSRRVLITLLVVLHLFAGPIGLPLRGCSYEALARAMDRLDEGVPREPSVREQTVVVINAPLNIMLSYLQIARAARGVPRPDHLYWLASSSSEIQVERVGERSLRVTQAEGFLRRPEETHYRAQVDDLPAGTRITRAGMQIEIERSEPDQRPRSVLFHFAEALESPRYLLRVYQEKKLVPWQPPAAGAGQRFPAQQFVDIITQEVLP